jgi:hypothetical protein
MLGLLSNRGFKNQTVMSLLHMVNNSREIEWFPVMSPTCYSISEHRNWLAAQSVKRECDYLMMVDDDMVFPPETASVLLSRNKDIISVPYHTKKFPKCLNVLVLEPTDNAEEKFVEVSAVGTGIILIKTSVFQTVSQPWFDIDKEPNGFTTMGEDFWFCRKARENGIKIWSEPLEIGHLGDYLY